MQPRKLRRALLSAIKTQLPVFIWGPPGVGKSALTQQIADEIDYDLIDLRLSQLDPADIRGVPAIDFENRLTIWNAPEFLPRKGVHGDYGILFFDELNSAHRDTQTVAYQLILDRKVGNYVLPDGWTVLAAGNRMEDSAIVNPMSSALSNRFMHLDFTINNDDWITHATANKFIPEVVSFIRYLPQYLHNMGEPGSKPERAFPTPRSWEYVSRILPNTEEDLKYDIVAGNVGEGVAGQFIAYIDIYTNLPDLDKILNDPDSVHVDTGRPEVMFAVSGALAHKANEDTFDKILQYADRMPPEFQTILIQDALSANKELRHQQCFKDWTRKNANVLI
jgi:hypothetical protein